ncbi:MAG: ThuA domain-containing protein [Chloroflexota bacterium]
METPILLVSAGLVHPSLPARFWLRRALAARPGYEFRRAASLEVLPGLPPGAFRAIVFYAHHASISPAALESLDDFLQAGGGLLAVHSASASFKAEPRYHDLLGGRFVGHGPVKEFAVQPAAPHDEVFGDVSPFSVRDELYRHEYDAANRIHFYTAIDDEREPVVWTRRRGQGRVCYCALGHTASAIHQPPVHRLLQRGLAWVDGGEAP